MGPQNIDQRSEKSKLDISKCLLSLYEDNPEEFMHRIVTQDETYLGPSH